MSCAQYVVLSTFGMSRLLTKNAWLKIGRLFDAAEWILWLHYALTVRSRWETTANLKPITTWNRTDEGYKCFQHD